MTNPTTRATTVLAVAALVVAACSGDDEGASSSSPAPTTTAAERDDQPAATSPTTDPAVSTTAPPSAPEDPPSVPDRAYYILPPGNYGGLPTTDDSLDQLPLYDGLTPLRGEVDDADLEELFLPMDFEPVGSTTEEPTGRDGLSIVYDDFGVPHISGETREDLAFGAGWVTARDRGLLIDFGRGASRVAVADVPGINAFSLVTGGQQFVPSAAAEQLVTDQIQLIRDTYGSEGDEIIAEAQAYADGMNAYWEANDVEREPATVNDVIAVTAFIGSIFGAGGGAEAANANYLSALENRLGPELGRQVFDDMLRFTDPEAPTTIEERFDYPTLTGGDVTGSVSIDEGSLISLDPRDPAPGSAPVVDAAYWYPAVEGPPLQRASNFLTVAPSASENATTLAVMGPQLGYFYPEIVQQIHLSGAGIEAQGVAVPGLAMYILIGRTEHYAWSLTSATQDVRDVYAEVLCEPDGSEPSRESGHYEYDGGCIPFEIFDAGTLDGVPIRYPVSVHGPVIGTATSDGTPVALTSKRSTFGRDGLNLGALRDMTEGDADTPESFFEAANKFGFTFNWGYANRDGVAYFASGRLPVRPAGLDRRLPTLGTGDYEWEGFLELDEHPHADGHSTGRLLNWNNQSAPGFMHGDNEPYGSVHRVENFDQWPDQVDLAGVVSVMNRAATEDERSTLWPVISEILDAGSAPSDLAGEAERILDAWATADAPLLDADEDGDWDAPGAVLLDRSWGPIVEAATRPVLGPLWDDGADIRGVDAASLLDKDLRALLGRDVEGPFVTQFCGAGDLDACAADLWSALDGATAELAAEQGDDPTAWRMQGLRTTFAPGLIPDDFRSTNRPTYQQVIEFGTPS